MNWWVFVKCEPKSSQIKEPKTWTTSICVHWIYLIHKFHNLKQFQQWWDRILRWGRETYIMVPGQLSLSECEQNQRADCGLQEDVLRPYTPLMISGTPVERVSSFKYLGVNISEDLTWTTHIQTQVKKARQRLYHLRQLRKFRVSPTILKTFIQGP